MRASRGCCAAAPANHSAPHGVSKTRQARAFTRAGRYRCPQESSTAQSLLLRVHVHVLLPTSPPVIRYAEPAERMRCRWAVMVGHPGVAGSGSGGLPRRIVLRPAAQAAAAGRECAAEAAQAPAGSAPRRCPQAALLPCTRTATAAQ